MHRAGAALTSLQEIKNLMGFIDCEEREGTQVRKDMVQIWPGQSLHSLKGTRPLVGNN